MAEISQNEPGYEAITTEWNTAVADPTQIHRELENLWSAWYIRKAALEPAKPGSDPASESLRMRPSTLNLITVAETDEDAYGVIDLVSSIIDFQPSRTIVLKHGVVADDPTQIHFAVTVHEHYFSRTHPPVAVETIVVTVAQGRDDVLASIVAPLFIPDLPDILFLPSGSLFDNTLVSEMVEMIDGIVFDSSTSADPASDFEFVQRLMASESELEFADLAWYRTAQWRQLTAQFFDTLVALPSLDTLANVKIAYEHGCPKGRIGFTAAVLHAAWLASRLNWRSTGEMVQDSNGWHTSLRAGPIGRGREPVIAIEEAETSVAGCSLDSVELISGGNAPGQFGLDRLDQEKVSATARIDSEAEVTRLIIHKPTTDALLISNVLKYPVTDPLYVDALKIAAVLWPVGVKL